MTVAQSNATTSAKNTQGSQGLSQGPEAGRVGNISETDWKPLSSEAMKQTQT